MKKKVKTECKKHKKIHKSRSGLEIKKTTKLSKKAKKKLRLKNKLDFLQNQVAFKDSVILELKRSVQNQKNEMQNRGDWFWKNYNSAMRYAKQNTAVYSSLESFSQKERKSEFQPSYSSNRRYQNHDESDDEDLTLTDEYLEFLKINMLHKAEREKEKKLKEQTSMEVTEISERDNIEDCKVPEINQEEAERAKEIELFYGKHGAKISGMETALQLTFNRNCDKNHPPYWPNLSFSFSFKQPLKLK